MVKLLNQSQRVFFNICSVFLTVPDLRVSHLNAIFTIRGLYKNNMIRLGDLMSQIKISMNPTKDPN